MIDFPLKLVDPDDPVLNNETEQFNFNEFDIEEIQHHMINLMKEHNGIGLAANQVGINKSFFMAGDDEPSIFINPIIQNVSEEEIFWTEGCLTYPDLYLNIRRPLSVLISYQNEKGEWLEDEHIGLMARIILHEYDHLFGIDFLDHLGEVRMKLVLDKYRKMLKTARRQFKGVKKNG